MKIIIYANVLAMISALSTPAPGSAQSLQDMVLGTRYSNVTDDADDFRCNFCQESDECVASRAFLFTDQCLASAPGIWTVYSRDPTEGLCETVYDDPDCSIVNTRRCGLDQDGCVDGWEQFEVFEDACIESSAPQDEFLYPFVYASIYPEESNCINQDPPAVQNYFWGGEQDFCLATSVPDSDDGSQSVGSVRVRCDPDDQSHDLTFFSDLGCTVSESEIFARPNKECTPGVSEKTKDRSYFIACDDPRLHCKIPEGHPMFQILGQDNDEGEDTEGEAPTVENGSGSEAGSGSDTVVHHLMYAGIAMAAVPLLVL